MPERSSHFYRWLAVWLALSTLFSGGWMAPSPGGPPLASATMPLPILTVWPAMAYNITVCSGDKVKFQVQVVSGLLGSVGVPGATLSLAGKTITTDADGFASWSDTPKSSGIVYWMVTASKTGYTSSSPTQFKAIVVNCAWKIGLDYDDSYVDDSSHWTWQSSVELPDYVSFADDSFGNLVLVGQSSLQATYKGNFYMANQAFDCQSQPDPSGAYPIHLAGTYKASRLSLKLSAEPVSLPGTVTLSCKDHFGEYQIQPQKYPTMPTLDLINEAVPSLTNLHFKKSGGVVHFRIPHMAIWPLPAKDMSGVLVVTRDKLKQNTGVGQ